MAFPEIIGVGHCCQDYICSIENYPLEDSSTHILDMEWELLPIYRMMKWGKKY